MKMDVTKKIKVAEGQKIDLKKYPTKYKPLYVSKEDCQQQLKSHLHELIDMQDVFLCGQPSFVIINISSHGCRR
jgi:hypothetical protein